MQTTDPSYISQSMFDMALLESVLENVDDKAVRNQAIKLIGLFRGSKFHDQVIADIEYAAKSSGHISPKQLAEIAFVMGLQYGFELSLRWPPTVQN